MTSKIPTMLRLSGSLIATVLTTACGIRIPVDHHVQHIDVHRQITAPPKTNKEPDVLVWMIADKYHTGMVFPYDWLLDSGYIPPTGFGHPHYVTMSWGNRDAYSKQGIDNSWKMFRVLFTPTRSVMELIPANWNVVEVCPHQRIWRKLVARDRGPQLAAFLNGCSVTNPDGTPKVVCESSWGHGVQLESRYSYFIPRVCNVWTAQTIEAMGGDINPWFGLTADGMARQIERPPNNFEKIWNAYQKES